MKQIFLGIGSVVGVVVSFLAAPFAMAQTFGLGVTTINQLRLYVLCVLVGYMFEFLITISIIMVLYAAYLYVTAGDNAEQVRKAHKTIIWGVVALLVSFIASGFPSIIGSIWGAGGIPSCDA